MNKPIPWAECGKHEMKVGDRWIAENGGVYELHQTNDGGYFAVAVLKEDGTQPTR